jgi:hypothetical protein
MRVGLVLVAGLLTAPPVVEAGRPARHTEPVRVVWLRPTLVPSARRAALSRILIAAAQGQSLRGIPVRDSRPWIDATDLLEVNHPSPGNGKP